MVLGAQLYTVRDRIKTLEGIESTLKSIASIGYTTVQVSGMGKIEPEKLREICDRFGLKIVITHTNPDRILAEPEAVAREHKILGCDLIGIGKMPQKYGFTVQGVKSFIADYMPAAKVFEKNGMRLMYHNHNYEFERVNGKLIIDLLAEGFDSELLGFTLDTYWVQAGGADPVEIIEKYSGRIPAVHLKDMTYRNSREASVMAPVGEGNMNWNRILPACERAGTKWALVEQDTCEEDPLVCLKKSFGYLHGLHLK
jgi:sugar phosphate isomerase/epimerase